MLKDDKYAVHRFYDGKDTEIGTFKVSDGSIKFSNDDDKLNSNLFPDGPMSPHTESLIDSYMKGEHNHYSVKKI